MKVSYKWLSEYVDLSGFTAAELAEKLTRSGIEVDVVEPLDKGVNQVVVGYVKAREKHPDADKLNVCIVDAGTGEDLQIVCGAKNVDAGQKVPVALIGSTLPGDFKIKKAKLRGVESQGMICSAKELGLNDKLLPKEIQEGILVLPEDTELGTDIHQVLDLDDAVMELDLTPNRSDCLSMIGTAYEIAAILGRDVRLPADSEGIAPAGYQAADHISVEISSPEHCHHYAARYIRDVQIGASPLWMQNRLMAAGVRPINNIVDITNYVMLEYGQPLHAFDADRLHDGHIDVRLARSGERMTTLDDVERTLEPHMLLITDGKEPVAIAGVMGGANSEVTAETKAILLESARFAGSSVRKTSRQLGLRSEASLRFEKEANPDALIPALNRAASLIAQYAGGVVAEGIVDVVAGDKAPIVIDIAVSKINAYLGTELASEEVAAIFKRLHFAVDPFADGKFRVHVPNRRGDITRDVDLIEEVARLYGYDNIPLTLMSGTTTPGALTREQSMRRTLRRLMTDSGLHEMVNYSVTHPDNHRQFPGLFPQAKPIRLSMPMSEERSVLRASLVPQLLEQAAYNRNRDIHDVAVFEIGGVFISGEEKLSALPQEKLLLTMLITGAVTPPHWSGAGRNADFYDLKGIVENMCGFLGVQELRFESLAMEGMHPGRTAQVKTMAGEDGEISLGFMGQLHPQLQAEYDLKDVYIAEFELSALYKAANGDISYKPLPRYPGVVRDMAVVVERSLPAEKIIGIVKEEAGAMLESVSVFDVYTGDKVAETQKSIAFSLHFRNSERTLTDEEVAAAFERIIAKLSQTFGAQLRS